MTKADRLRGAILEAALDLADEAGWPAVRLHQIAERLQIELETILPLFAELDDVADWWLRQADLAMLAVRRRPGYASLPARDRLEQAMAAWFEHLGGRRRTLRDILLYKLQPPHVHLAAALVVATSRRVQWLRETAGLDAAGRRKSVEELGLTALFSAAVLVYVGDRSDDHSRTRRFISRRLDQADRAMGRLFAG